MEGTMLMGALAGFATAYNTGNLYIALVVAMVVGAMLSLIHAFLCITMRANQVVAGLAITMFGTGLANFLGQRLGPATNNFNLTGMNLASKFDNIAIPASARFRSSGLSSMFPSLPMLCTSSCRSPGSSSIRPSTAWLFVQ
jgi:simple sugar transport system permease protein